MSGLMHKVKDALSGDKHNTDTTTGGLENEHGTQSGVHDTPIDGSSTSATKPGVLHSTERGIHGDRDPGVGETSGLSNSGLGQGTGTSGSGYGYGDTTTTTGGTGLGGDGGLRSGPQFTGSGDRDTGLVQSGVDSTGREGLSGTGSGYDNTRDTGLGGTGSGLGGTGSGYDNTRDTGLSGTGSGYDNTRDTGLGGTGSGLGGTGSGYDNTRDTGLSGTGSGYDNTRGTGLGGTGSKYDNTRDLSGNTGTGYDSSVTGGSGTGYDNSTGGTGLTGSGYDSGRTGNTSTGTGLTGKVEQYVEGSERHHPGDGHPEDIVHPGPHETRTAKALDPHLNQ